MQLRRYRPQFLIHVEVFILLSCAILLLPIKWVIAWGLAIIFHESCHYAAIRLCGRYVSRIKVGIQGVVLQTDTLSCSQELICTLAGPLGSLLLLLPGKYMPATAVCVCMQTAYNLLPIFPLDGGRALRCMIHMLAPGRAGERFEKIQQYAALTLILLICIYGAVVWKLGATPILIAVILLIKNKSLANAKTNGYNSPTR